MNYSKMTKAQLIEMLEEAQAAYKSEQERADILSDKLSKLEDGEDDDRVIIDHDEHKSLLLDQETLESLVGIQEDLKTADNRAKLGVDNAFDEYITAVEAFMDFEINPSRDGIVISIEEAALVVELLDTKCFGEGDDFDKLNTKLERLLS